MGPWLDRLMAAAMVFMATAVLTGHGWDAAAQQPAAPQSPASQPLASSPSPVRTPVPLIAKGKGDTCVAPTDWMRRFHMTALNHKRDDTVHDGIRTPKFSLKGCIDCHAVEGADGKPVTVKDERHFCRSCHDYAAVKVDCFECHASRPDEADQAQADKAADASGKAEGRHHHHGAAAREELTRLQAALGAYLEGGQP